MDLRYTLRYLDVPIKSKSYILGDNRSVITWTTLPHSTLSKRHNILAFQRVKEAIAAKIIDFHWIKSEYNLSNMLNKHWEQIKIFPLIQKLLITCGSITLTNGLSTPHSRFPSSTQNNTYSYILHFLSIIHVSPRTCHIHHKRRVTEVCHIAHFWESHGGCAMPEIPVR